MNNGTVILAGVTGFNGTTIIAQGTLELANALALQNSTLNYSGGTLAFSGITAATLGGLNGTQNLSLINLAAAPLALTVGAENSNTTYAGAFTGGGSLTKTGTGTLTLTGANNHTGGTTVLGGNLTLAGGTLGSSGSTILVGNGATGVSFDVTGGTVTAATLNVAPNGGSTGDNVSITGTGSATFNSVNLGSGSDTSGPLTINTTGSVSLGAFIDFKDLQGNGPSTTSGLIINGGTVTAASVIIQDTTSGANMNMNGGSLTIGNTSSTGAFKIGNSTSTRGGFLTMTGGSLTYLGTDGLLLNTASGGANGANISGANAVATLSGVTLNQVNAAGATSSLVVSSGATLYLGGVGLVLNQPGGAVTASFANATVGAIANWTSSAPITLAGATTFQTANGSAVAHSISLGGVLSGAGALTETGLGTLTLSGIDTYTGPTTVSAGTLVLTGSLAGSATVQSGATLGGTGKITGNLTVSSGAGFLLNASGNLSVTGNLTWNGNLTVTGASGLPVGNYTLLGYNGTLSGSPAFTYVPPSGASQAATFSTATAHVITVTVFGPPSPPTGLTAAPGNGNVTLNWTGSAGATSYTVQRSTTSGGGYTTVATGVTGTTYKDTTPSNGTPYYYIVVANNAAGAGAGSTQAVATPVAPPAAPSDLAATAGNGNNTLTWSPVSGAANYTLARATAPGVETPLAAGLAAGPYLDTNVTNGTTYYYILTATNAGGTGPGSPEVSATPAATLAQWASAAFGNSTNANLTGPDANPSGDGIPNLLKYFYGLDPATNSGTPPVSTAPDNSGNLLLTFHLSKNLTGVTYQIQSSPDLLNWTNTGVQATEVSDQGAYYIMQASVPLGSNPYLYLRIKVTGP
jgi:autotransporter-associated beta strand protein